jgi:hypothetical protein
MAQIGIGGQPMRRDWRHSMLPTNELRYSIHFRTRVDQRSAHSRVANASLSSYSKFRQRPISIRVAPRHHESV